MGSIERIKAALTRTSDFRKHLLVQSIGTISSQLIPLIAAPLLTRLFSPGDFGLYGSVVSISALAAIVITFRIDHGVMVAPNDQDARKIASLSISIAGIGALIFACGSALVLAALGKYEHEGILVWVILSPLSGFLIAIVRTYTLYSNRLKIFNLVSKARIYQSVCVAVVSLTLGYLAYERYGLIIAMMAGYLLYILMLARPLWPLERISLPTVRSIIKTNSRFISYSLPADLVNTLSWRVPFIIFPIMFGLDQTGYLSLAYTVVATPTRFIGSALGEVFYSHAARQYEERGSCWTAARSIVLALMAISVVGFLILFLIAQPLYTTVFGPAWVEAATYTRILIPMIMIRFVTSPLSVVFYITGRQKEDFQWQVAFLILTSIALYGGTWLGEIKWSLIAFSAIGSTMYAYYFMLIRKFAMGEIGS